VSKQPRAQLREGDEGDVWSSGTTPAEFTEAVKALRDRVPMTVYDGTSQ
jgi:hypothetical protein